MTEINAKSSQKAYKMYKYTNFAAYATPVWHKGI